MFTATDKVLCLGRSGCGKSFLGRKVQEIYPRVVIFDTLHEYDDETDIVRNFDEFSARILQLQSSPAFRLVFQFSIDSENQELHFEHSLRVLYAMGNVFIVIEEIQEFSSPHSLSKYLRGCILTGRHRKIGMLFTTQRPGELNKTILSQCAHVFAGQIHERNDLNYISGFIGGDSAQKLINLPPRKFLYFRPGEKISVVNNDLSNSANSE